MASEEIPLASDDDDWPNFSLGSDYDVVTDSEDEEQWPNFSLGSDYDVVTDNSESDDYDNEVEEQEGAGEQPGERERFTI